MAKVLVYRDGSRRVSFDIKRHGERVVIEVKDGAQVIRHPLRISEAEEVSRVLSGEAGNARELVKRLAARDREAGGIS